MRTIRFLCLCSLLSFGTTAEAGLVRFEFAGALTQVFGTLPDGTSFTGSIVFETGQTGTEIPLTPATVGLGYSYESFRFEIDGLVFERGAAPVPALGVEVYDYPGAGPTTILSARLAGLPGGSQTLGGRELWRLDVWLFSLGNIISTNNALPADASFFQQGDEGLLFLRFVGEDFTQMNDVDGRITSLTSTPVPLPATLPMLLAGVLVLGTHRRTHRQRTILERRPFIMG